MGVMVGAGNLKLKTVFMAAAKAQNKPPTNQTLKVKVGISGSSVLETEALTSGKGESSSYSNSNLSSVG